MGIQRSGNSLSVYSPWTWFLYQFKNLSFFSPKPTIKLIIYCTIFQFPCCRSIFHPWADRSRKIPELGHSAQQVRKEKATSEGCLTYWTTDSGECLHPVRDRIAEQKAAALGEPLPCSAALGEQVLTYFSFCWRPDKLPAEPETGENRS